MDEAAPSGLSVAQKGADGWPVMCSWAFGRLPVTLAGAKQRGERKLKQSK